MPLAEWRCPNLSEQHPTWNNHDGTVTDMRVEVLADPPPEQGWRCFWCQAPLERVREIATRSER